MRKRHPGTEIPYYNDINEFLASVPVDARTSDPLFYCFRLQKNKDGSLYRPPFKRGFYFVGLLASEGKTNIIYDRQERIATPQQLLFKNYLTLINTHYIEKRQVEAYAEMLFVTPNHLSQTIKSVSGKNALHFINERLLTEARSLISYTELSIAEIAYKLDFSDPSNFGKFFKKQLGMTPFEFREKNSR